MCIIGLNSANTLDLIPAVAALERKLVDDPESNSDPGDLSSSDVVLKNDEQDILKGQGIFSNFKDTDEMLKTWHFVAGDEYEAALDGDTLKLKKNDGAKQMFDDGLMLKFDKAQPKHITFQCKTDNEDKESCNVRLFRLANDLTKDKGNSVDHIKEVKRAETSIFFRYGFFRHLKINYNTDYTNLRQKNDVWNKVDIVMDWKHNHTTMYVNGDLECAQPFFEATDRAWQAKDALPEYEGSDSLILYTLSPATTSWFKNVKVCKERCAGGDDFKFSLKGSKLRFSSSMSLLFATLLVYMNL